MVTAAAQPSDGVTKYLIGAETGMYLFTPASTCATVRQAPHRATSCSHTRTESTRGCVGATAPSSLVLVVDIERVQEILAFPNNQLIVILAGACIRRCQQKEAPPAGGGRSRSPGETQCDGGNLPAEKSQTVYTLSFAVLGDQALKVRTHQKLPSSSFYVPSARLTFVVFVAPAHRKSRFQSRTRTTSA